MPDPSPIERALRRIEFLADECVSTIHDLMSSDDPQVALRAAMTLLDRAGITAKNTLQLSGETKTTLALDAEIDVLLKELVAARSVAGDELVGGRTLEVSARPSDNTTPPADLDAELEAELASLPPGTLPN